MLATARIDNELTLPLLPVEPDLFGQVLMDAYRGMTEFYFLRRDDNYLERESCARYFRSWEKLPAHQRCLLNHARGQVLDLGAGAGQHALALQDRGIAVTAVDASPCAVELCRLRGVVDAREMDVLALSCEPASYDTALLLGNNLGIAGDPGRLRLLLTHLHQIIRPGGQILADMLDYTDTRESVQLHYQRRNEAHGRYPGSIRWRVEYDGKGGPDFDWLRMELSDLRRMCTDTGWRIARCLQVNTEATYAISIERVG